jgi:hypothetical protein
MASKFSAELLAPCGMNCAVCKAYLAYRCGVPRKRGSVTHCSGCIPRGKNCFIKRACKKLSKGEVRFCYECSDLPCENVDRVARRYLARYGFDFVGNLREVEQLGVEAFLRGQAERFRCPVCGDVVSVHDGKCYACLAAKQKMREK